MSKIIIYIVSGLFILVIGWYAGVKTAGSKPSRLANPKFQRHNLMEEAPDFVSEKESLSAEEKQRIRETDQATIGKMLELAKQLQTRAKAGENLAEAGDSAGTQKGWPADPFYFCKQAGKLPCRVIARSAAPRNVEDDSGLYLYCEVTEQTVSPVYADLAVIPVHVRLSAEDMTPQRWQQALFFREEPSEACKYIPGARMKNGKCQIN